MLVERYKALYAGLTVWSRRAHGEHDLPEHTALIALSVFAWLNTFSLFMLIQMISGVSLEIPHLKAWGMIGYFLILILHYIALFDRADVLSRKSGQVTTGWRLLLYPAASVIVAFAILYTHMRRAGYPIY